MKKPEINALADDLARQAGLVGRFGHASPQMLAFMQLVASRCLDVLHRPVSNEERYAEIAQMFGAASSIDSAEEAVQFRVILHGAPQLSRRERALAESVYGEALRQKLGGAEALSRAYTVSRADPDSEEGKRWRAAESLARFLALERLAYVNAMRLEIEEAESVHFEIEFTHTLR